MYMQQLNNMVASGAAEADPQVAAVVTTAGAAAATAAPYASAAAPYAGAGGADLVLAYGLGGWPTFTFFVKVGTTGSTATAFLCQNEQAWPSVQPSTG